MDLLLSHRGHASGEALQQACLPPLTHTDGEGNVTHWHYPGQKRLHHFTEPENSVLTVAYSPDGSHFATAGRDRMVRVYDESTKEPLATMGSTVLAASAGHSNRIFASCWVPGDAHTLLTGGWDNTVRIWDTRSGKAEGKMFGPHIAGDALDVRGSRVLAGSWRPEDPLEVWDLGARKRLATCDFNGSATASDAHSTLGKYQSRAPNGLVYGAAFSSDAEGAFIVAGGSGSNCVKVFDGAEGSGHPLVGAILGLPGSVFAVATEGNLIAVAGAFESIYLYTIEMGARPIPSILHEGGVPEGSHTPLPPSSLTPHHAAAMAGAADSTAPVSAAAAAGASDGMADRAMAALAGGHMDDGDDEEDQGDDGGVAESKAGDDYGTRSSIVGGSGLAAVRARRASAQGEGKEGV